MPTLEEEEEGKEDDLDSLSSYYTLPPDAAVLSEPSSGLPDDFCSLPSFSTLPSKEEETML